MKEIKSKPSEGWGKSIWRSDPHRKTGKKKESKVFASESRNPRNNISFYMHNRNNRIPASFLYHPFCL
jgi:hypothetical protein